MAKLDLNHLKRKYGKTGWTGGKYRELVSNILERNNKTLANQILEENTKKLQAVVRNAKDNKLKQIVTPPVQNVIKGDVILRKSADSGKIITNTLRDKIVSDLKASFEESKIVQPTGINAGKVNPKTAQIFEDKLKSTFENYTKKNPDFGGVPSNIHTIAVTEVRSVISDTRDRYVGELLSANPKVRIIKEWVHNKSLSKTPRVSHMLMNGKTVEYNDSFTLPTGVVMKHPHDPSAPPEEVIGCHCEIRYRLA